MRLGDRPSRRKLIPSLNHIGQGDQRVIGIDSQWQHETESQLAQYRTERVRIQVSSSHGFRVNRNAATLPSILHASITRRVSDHAALLTDFRRLAEQIRVRLQARATFEPVSEDALSLQV